MKKKIGILLALCLAICTISYLPVQAGDDLSVESLGNWMTTPLVHNNDFYMGLVKDENEYWYLVTCTISIGGPTVVVSTSYYLTDWRFATQDEKDEYAEQVKAISTYVDVTTSDGASDSFGITDYVQGESYERTYTKTYSANILSAVGRHGFGSEKVPFIIYDTRVY